MFDLPKMATSFLILLLLLSTQASSKPLPKTPYLSSNKVLFPDYQKMLTSFKIFTYPPLNSFFNYSTPSEHLFHYSLLHSPFRTENPSQAHLFLVSFDHKTSSRALTRYIKELRSKFPYWDRTLGADHFFISRAGISYSSDRNSLELKKNGIQISLFPTLSGNFIPHKDVTLPPFYPSRALLHAPSNNKTVLFQFVTFLKYHDDKSDKSQTLVNGFLDELSDDQDFKILSEPSDIFSGKFCLFFYGGDLTMLVEAMGAGCVPVVITDSPIQDLPLMDVLRWAEMAIFVGAGKGIHEVKKVVSGISEEKYKSMKKLGVEASKHLVWNESPQPFDAFHMVMYQLWLRRHTIRYAQRDSI